MLQHVLRVMAATNVFLGNKGKKMFKKT